MIYKNKEHTFVIYNGIVTTPQAVLGRRCVAYHVSLNAPAANMTRVDIDIGVKLPRLVLNDGKKRPLANVTINGSTVELAAL